MNNGWGTSSGTGTTGWENGLNINERGEDMVRKMADVSYDDDDDDDEEEEDEEEEEEEEDDDDEEEEDDDEEEEQ